MELNGIGSEYSLNKEALQRIQFNRTLDLKNAISFKDLPENERYTSKDMGIEVKGIDQSSYENVIDVSLKDWSGQEINTTNFEFVINHNFDLSKDQKETLNKAIQSATDIMNKSTANGDTYGMRISQTNMELKYIGQIMIPEKYRDEYNSYVDDYTNQLSDHFVNLEKMMAENLTDTSSDALIQSGWKEKGKDILNDLESGSDIFQTSEKAYQSLYDNIDLTNPNTVKKQLGDAYNNILTKQTTNWWGSDKTSISSEIKYLSEKWNSLMDVFGDNNNKFTTSINQYA